MMQQVCEKCGAVIEQPTMKNTIGYKPYYLKIRLFRSPIPFVYNEYDIDLCNKCRDLFDEWMMEPPKEETDGRLNQPENAV